MARSLYSTVLHNYTYEEIKDLCFTPGSTFGNAFDCQWKVWRDKAKADFGISEEFFDLVRSLSGPQRYLQISTYIELNIYSIARVDKDSLVEGVYEPEAGIQEAWGREEPEAMIWFAQHLGPEKVREVEKLISDRRIWKRDHPKVYFSDEDDLDYLSLVVESGNLDILDRIIHRYFILPEGFSIEKDIPRIPFWEMYDEDGNDRTLLNLPLQEIPTDDFVQTVIHSGDVRIVDFFRSIFGDDVFVENIAERHLSAYGSERHRKPEEAYTIDLRFLEKVITKNPFVNYGYSIETLLHSANYGTKEQSSNIEENMGNIPYLMALFSSLPYDKELVIDLVEDERFRKDYPLSVSLLERYI
ncbi:Hypothetical protein ZAZAV_191 [Cedratvirus Zaza IHUMI]|uniref:Uncharacterized protein n=1 Tax=Cedratvirus Zaza IHUMI TaxID=2126979 RepID=A0A2R8FDS2_9VIRU|nr:Hypothetical protein ZAZAV_191 [Cedratvirus Zaza IHUMI]